LLDETCLKRVALVPDNRQSVPDQANLNQQNRTGVSHGRSENPAQQRQPFPLSSGAVHPCKDRERPLPYLPQRSHAVATRDCGLLVWKKSVQPPSPC